MRADIASAAAFVYARKAREAAQETETQEAELKKEMQSLKQELEAVKNRVKQLEEGNNG